MVLLETPQETLQEDRSNRFTAFVVSGRVADLDAWMTRAVTCACGAHKLRLPGGGVRPLMVRCGPECEPA